MRLREAQEQDYPRLIEMWRACSKEENKDLPDEMYPLPGPDEGILEAIDFLQRSESSKIFVTTQDDGKAVGFVTASIGYQPAVIPHQFLVVHTMYIEPEYRGGETYEALTKALTLWTKSVNLSLGYEAVQYAELTTRPSNRQIKRWADRGWSVYGVKMWRRIEE